LLEIVGGGKLSRKIKRRKKAGGGKLSRKIKRRKKAVGSPTHDARRRSTQRRGRPGLGTQQRGHKRPDNSDWFRRVGRWAGVVAAVTDFEKLLEQINRLLEFVTHAVTLVT
jgi:hypothetical protein